ncbi:MAG: flagellar biosynthesis protein FlhF, partial [Lachnospiraceae bacterium]|nr:flagellar biosynthesis protein FlhF [Lachnospiraceae bacterium]
MIIKKFQGKTEEEAVAQAKKELGEGVVTMNVRTVKPRGFFKWLKSPVIEVTVAKEEESEVLQSKAEVEAARTENLKDAVASIDRLRMKEENPETVKKGPSVEEGMLEERLESIQNLLEQKLKKQEGAVIKDTENVKEEVSSQMLEFTRLLYHTMIENEVYEKYANQMVDEVEQNFGSDMQVEYILSHIYQKMVLKFGKVEHITPSRSRGP